MTDDVDVVDDVENPPFDPVPARERDWMEESLLFDDGPDTWGREIHCPTCRVVVYALFLVDGSLHHRVCDTVWRPVNKVQSPPPPSRPSRFCTSGNRPGCTCSRCF